jgi:hypothetical protein
LDKDEIYQVFRDPVELAKAAPTFNNIPILSKHEPITSDTHKSELVVGSTGTDAVFEYPYLKNSIVIWPKKNGIDAVESGNKAELSAAYRYDAIPEPGVWEGQPYQLRMVNIKGNHVAIVKSGRAGADVCVADSALWSREWQLIEDAILSLTSP